MNNFSNPRCIVPTMNVMTPTSHTASTYFRAFCRVRIYAPEGSAYHFQSLLVGKGFRRHAVRTLLFHHINLCIPMSVRHGNQTKEKTA